MNSNYIFIALIFCIIIFIILNNFYKPKNNYIIIEKNLIDGPNIYYNKKVIEIKINHNNQLNNLKNEIFNIHKKINYEIDYIVINNNKIICTYEYDSISLQIYDIACDKINFNKKYSDKINSLKEEYDNIKIGISTNCIIQNAIKKNIPYIRLNDDNLYQLGWGIKQKKIESSCTSNTYAIAESICKDKNLTKTILESVGIPIAKGYITNNEIDLIKYYNLLNSPVVIKPYNGNHGDNVFINISDINTLKKSYNIVIKNSDYIIIEKFVEGNDYRILIINHKFIAGTKRIPPFVIGNNKNSIKELIDIINNDPRRGVNHTSSLTKIEIDNTMKSILKEKGYNINTILDTNTKVYLRKNGNLSTGGISEDVTDIVHKSVIDYAITASKQINLDICGIDIVCKDISKPLTLENGCFIEVNSGPGLRMHLFPSIGKSRDVGYEIISNLFPKNENGRIPIIAITGTNGKTTTVNLISFILNKKYIVGKTTTNGIYVNNNLIEAGDCSGPKSAKKILMNPDVELCVFECARGGILKGLGFDKCDIAILTNIGSGDHLGKNFGNSTLDDIFNIKSVLFKNISPNGYAILNANDLYIYKILNIVKTKIILFSINKNNKLIREYKLNGSPVIYFDKKDIVLCFQGNEEIFNINNIPIIHDNLLFQIENVMISIACCYALNIDIKFIKEQLSNFSNDIYNNPGRFNILKYKKSQIIIDYAHNMDSILSISNYIKTKKANKKIILFGAAGDRDNIVIQKMTSILYESFDIIILFVDKDTKRGREESELFNLMLYKISFLRGSSTLINVVNKFICLLLFISLGIS
jgi:cyanophycin synthetase